MQTDNIVAGIIKYLTDLGHPEWVEEVAAKLQKKAKKAGVVVESAVELDSGSKKEIEEIVGKAEFVINKNLVGGIKVMKGDQLIDLSVQKRLEDIYAN